MWACHLHQQRAAECLLDAGTDPKITNIIGETALHMLDDSSEHLVKKMVAAGADVNAQNLWGATPLMMAIQADNYLLASVLLANGADPNIKTFEGYSSFDMASFSRSLAAPQIVPLMHKAVAAQKKAAEEAERKLEETHQQQSSAVAKAKINKIRALKPARSVFKMK